MELISMEQYARFWRDYQAYKEKGIVPEYYEKYNAILIPGGAVLIDKDCPYCHGEGYVYKRMDFERNEKGEYIYDERTKMCDCLHDFWLSVISERRN